MSVQAASTTVRSSTSVPDVNEAGRVLAQLDDWRAITFVLVFVIVMLLLERIWTQREMRLERTDMKMQAKSFADSATKVADALGALRVEVIAMRITAARVESVVAEAATHEGG